MVSSYAIFRCVEVVIRAQKEVEGSGRGILVFLAFACVLVQGGLSFALLAASAEVTPQVRMP